MDYEQAIKQILGNIKKGTISPQEGKEQIRQLKQMKPENERKAAPLEDGVAIIGMSGRFPGADNIEDFWKVLSNGEDCITEVPKERWDNDQYYDPDEKNLRKTNSKWGGFLQDIDKFDPLFFHISGMEAEVMDPQQRIFLEESYHALEQAGYANERMSGEKCGVYVASAPRDYLMRVDDDQVSAQAFWGNTGSILASRISYYLNLKGPAISLDTACSSSLVAVHLACQGILSNDVKMAIAGGAWICTTQHYYILTSNAGMLSPDGKCKTFDDSADGIVNGECVGAIVLKSLKDAIKDHDNILGIIRSSGINQDGKTNGITAPSSLSQTKLEMEVYEKASINPETITYIETHGTGTKLGDPIEIEALDHAFKQYTQKKNFCALGSVKTNIGHASLGAGIASVIKVLLALKHKKIPASLNFNKLNEHIELKDSAFFVNTQLRDWTGNGEALRAAVSSFGLGGTNAHLVIEEYKQNRPNTVTRGSYPILLSAKTKQALFLRVRELADWTKKNECDASLQDVSYTLSVCRENMDYRAGFVVRSLEELNEQLELFIQSESTYQKKKMDKNQKEFYLELMDEITNDAPESSEYRDKLSELVEAYEGGMTIDWSGLYNLDECFKIALPVYPFARESYWATPSSQPQNGGAISKLHPFIDENVSSLREQKFLSCTEHNAWMKSMTMGEGKQEFPFSIFLEMMLFAVKVSSEQKAFQVEEFALAKNNRDAKQINELLTRIYIDSNNCYAEITENGSQTGVFAQMKASIKGNCKFRETVTEEAFRRILEECTHNIDQNIRMNGAKTEALTECKYSIMATDAKEKTVLEPAVLKAIVQAALLMGSSHIGGQAVRVHGFDKMEFKSYTGTSCYIHLKETARMQEEILYSVQVIDENKEVWINITNLRIGS